MRHSLRMQTKGGSEQGNTSSPIKSHSTQAADFFGRRQATSAEDARVAPQLRHAQSNVTQSNGTHLAGLTVVEQPDSDDSTILPVHNQVFKLGSPPGVARLSTQAHCESSL